MKILIKVIVPTQITVVLKIIIIIIPSSSYQLIFPRVHWIHQWLLIKTIPKIQILPMITITTVIILMILLQIKLKVIMEIMGKQMAIKVAKMIRYEMIHI